MYRIVEIIIQGSKKLNSHVKRAPRDAEEAVPTDAGNVSCTLPPYMRLRFTLFD